jgi:hypothetical protein
VALAVSDIEQPCFECGVIYSRLARSNGISNNRHATMTILTVELDQYRGTVAQKLTETRRLLAKVESDGRMLRHRKKELETQLAAASALNPHYAAERARCAPTLIATAQAAQDPRHQRQIADVFDDLWRSSCEMPDAPHLRKG